MVFFIFSDTAKFGIVRKNKKNRHSGESRNLIPIPAKAGISAAAKRREIVQLPPSAWRFLPSQEWDGERRNPAAERKIRVARRRIRQFAAKSDEKTTAGACFCELFALFCIGAKKIGDSGLVQAIPCYNSESVRGGAILTLTGVFR
ncbi:MAG: hypothetical protein ACR2QC_06420 [Gammaproteobacteria bacterium]